MAVKERKPLAFMSYVHLDDEHEAGRLTQFRERLSGEVRIQTGEDFPIFQDRTDIKWGQNWRERIEESLDEVTFLIPIITPGFFKSPECRKEVEQFLERERELKSNDLILPVYYVSCPVLDDDEERQKDGLARVIAERQWNDWRELRFEPFTSPEIRKALASMAVQIREALEYRLTPKRGTVQWGSASLHAEGQLRAEGTVLRAETAYAELAKATEAARGPVGKTEPPTRVVDPMHRGDHATITEAIEAARAGDRILVRPGLYQEALFIDKPLEIIGEGEPGEIEVETGGKNVLLFKATMGRVANLTLRQMGGHDAAGVSIVQGRLQLEDCAISSETQVCVWIYSGADPRVRRTRIAGGKLAGVFVHSDGRGTLEDNEIFEAGDVGVVIDSGGDPTLRRNRIHHCGGAGVLALRSGRGTLEDNEIFANMGAGISVSGGASLTIRRNRIVSNHDEAITILPGGAATVEDNDLRGNGGGAWLMLADDEANIKRSRNLEV